MLNTNAVAAVMFEANKLLDKLELETWALSPQEIDFLGYYQAKLASGPTSRSDDDRFLGVFTTWLRATELIAGQHHTP